jgi:hypothetical protein
MNFIPINSYIVRTDFYLENCIRFKEDYKYLEDWDFLQLLLLAGAKFRSIPEALGEYRIIGDGNTDIKQDPILFKRTSREISAQGALIAKQLGLNYFYQDLLEFGFGRINNLTSPTQKYIKKTFSLFKSMSDSNH